MTLLPADCELDQKSWLLLTQVAQDLASFASSAAVHTLLVQCCVLIVVLLVYVVHLVLLLLGVVHERTRSKLASCPPNYPCGDSLFLYKILLFVSFALLKDMVFLCGVCDSASSFFPSCLSLPFSFKRGFLTAMA